MIKIETLCDFIRSSVRPFIHPFVTLVLNKLTTCEIFWLFRKDLYHNMLFVFIGWTNPITTELLCKILQNGAINIPNIVN